MCFDLTFFKRPEATMIKNVFKCFDALPVSTQCPFAIFADKKMNNDFNERHKAGKSVICGQLGARIPARLVPRHVGARKRRFLESTRRSRRQIYFNRIIIISRNPERSIAPSWRSWLKVEPSREQSNRTEPENVGSCHSSTREKGDR